MIRSAKALHIFASIICIPNRFIPRSLLLLFAKIFLYLFSRSHSASQAPISLAELDNFLYGLLSSAAKRANNGRHPKQDIIKYHQFFKEQLSTGDRVLDIGFGDGYLESTCFSPDYTWTDIEPDFYNFTKVTQELRHLPINFVNCRAESLPDGEYNKIILSNVLEHIEDRAGLLRTINSFLADNGLLLIRVPLFDREWLTQYKKDLLVEYRLDPTHFIEYTEDSFRQEIQAAGFTIKKSVVRWSELYAVLHK